MGRLRPKRPHRLEVRPQRSPAQRLPSFPRQRSSTRSLPRQPQPQSLHLRQRRRPLRLRRQYLPPPLLRLGRRYPPTRQLRSQLRPIRQPRLTPRHRRPRRRQFLLPLSRPLRPRLRLIRQLLFLPRHLRPLRHLQLRRLPHPLYPLQYRAQPTLQRPLPYPNPAPTGPQCSIRLPTPV